MTTLRLRRDLVLIALPPQGMVTQRGWVLMPTRPTQERAGLVLQVGEAVTSVQPRERVIFDTYAAEEVTIDGWPCVVVPETALDAVVE